MQTVHITIPDAARGFDSQLGLRHLTASRRRVQPVEREGFVNIVVYLLLVALSIVFWIGIGNVARTILLWVGSHT